MPGEILVIAEHWRGHAESITLQLLTKGRELADALGVGLDVLVLGHDVGSVVASLKDKGADAIHTLDHAALGDAACGALAEAAVAALRDIAPKLTLVKTVTNDNGGTANASAWTLNAAGSGGFSGAGAPAVGEIGRAHV